MDSISIDYTNVRGRNREPTHAVLMLMKSLFANFLPITMALVAGALIPIQTSSGGGLGRALGSPLWGAAVTLSVSVIAIVVLSLALRLPAPSFSDALRAPWWAWIGGISAATYTATAFALLPRLGASVFIVCIIGGQMVGALLLDHFGLLGLVAKPVHLGRVVGVIVMVIGLLISQSNFTAHVDKDSAGPPVDAR